MRLADAVARTSSQTGKMRIAGALLGKGAKDMLPLLNLGRKGIEALGEGAAVMSTATAKSAKAFGDTMTTLAEHAKGLAYEVLQELLPSMNAAAGGMDKWLTANKEWLKTEIVSVIRDLVGIAKAFYGVIQNSVIPAVKSLQPLWEAFSGVVGKNNAMLLLFTATVAPKVLLAFAGIAKALAGLGLALAANPVGAAIIAIGAAVGFLGYSIYKERNAIKQAFDDLAISAQQGASLVATNVSDAVADLPSSWGETWQRLSTIAATIWDELSASAANGMKLVAGNIAAAGPAIAAEFQSVWGELSGFFTELWGGIKAVFSGAVGWIGDFAGQFIPAGFTAAWEATTGFFTGLWAGIKAIFWDALDWIGGFVAQFIPQPLLGAWRGLGEIFGAIWNAPRVALEAALAGLGALVLGFVPEPLLESWDRLGALFGAIWQAVDGIFTTAITALTGLVAGFVPQPIQDAWTGLADFFGSLWQGVVGWFEWAWGKIKPLIDLIAGAVASITGAIGNIGGALGNIGGAVGGAVGGAWNRLTGGVQQVEAAGASPTAAATTGPTMMPAADAPSTQNLAAAAAPVSKSEVQVNFANVPQGTRISETRSTGNTEVNLRSEYAGPRGAIAGAY